MCQPRLFLSTRGGGGACIGSMLPRLIGNLGVSQFINASNKFNCVLIIDGSNLTVQHSFQRSLDDYMSGYDTTSDAESGMVGSQMTCYI